LGISRYLPACGRQGEDYMCAVRLRRIEVSPLRPPCPPCEAGEAGSEVSRKGKAPSLERGRGKYSPPANPDRVTAEAVERRNNGFHSEHLNL